VSLIESYACRRMYDLFPKDIYNKEKRKKKGDKKEKKKGSNLWAIYQCLQIECNLTWARLLKP
jgi:hypothetical protein